MFGFKKRRRERLSRQPFPEEWRAILGRSVPFYERLTADDRKELQRHVLVFLAEKRFEGCGGLAITDEIKVTIAAQACVLLLHRQTDYYPGLRTILVYPSAYVAANARYVVGGMVVEGRDVRLGESWHHGTIVLAWDSIRHSTADLYDGQNLVFHEFAHQLDSSAGRRDSTPVLRTTSSFLAWARVLREEYERFKQDTRHQRTAVLDEYGANNPAEFFAVATEHFFEKPRELQQVYPRLYQELARFYQQDPAALAGPSPR